MTRHNPDNLDMRNETETLLHGPELLTVERHHAHVVRILEGTAYLTIEGDARDYFLRSGEEFRVEPHHRTIVQGWPETRVSVL